MTLDLWSRPALIVVDMQNDFVRVGAPLEIPDARATLPQHRRLLDACRATEVPVVYVRYVAGPQHHLVEWVSKLDWAAQLAAPVWACRRGHRRFYADVGGERECTDVVDEIYPRPEDYVVDKYTYGAFHRTSLADILASHGVDAVVVTGTVTQVCVEDTARQAFAHGYKTTIVADAVSSRAPERHRATLETFAAHYGWVLSTDDVLKGLGARASGRLAG
jgi:nicotinamidase-related amidase